MPVHEQDGIEELLDGAPPVPKKKRKKPSDAVAAAIEEKPQEAEPEKQDADMAEEARAAAEEAVEALRRARDHHTRLDYLYQAMQNAEILNEDYRPDELIKASIRKLPIGGPMEIAISIEELPLGVQDMVHKMLLEAVEEKWKDATLALNHAAHRAAQYYPS